ncbi:hypothetical protein NE237_010516 [Protea cynaroides]|uniref:Uncharacterized protein n=1 Tax=Protea cynaroides TaxID=273540 RepID=A0A9Q0KZX0_9MAGN|nr:hypothetical protein NE237_010516 [Protea cynaroides]
MKSNSTLLYDSQCVHYTDRRVSMHDRCFWDTTLLIVGFVRIIFRRTCGYCAFRIIEFTAGNGIENNVIGCWLMLHKERLIFLLLPFFSLFSVSYLLLNGWILERRQKLCANATMDK